MSSENSTSRPGDRPATPSGQLHDAFHGDFRGRQAAERQEADERRERQLAEQASLLNDPPARVRAWEKAHGLTLPRSAGHAVLARVAEATQLTLEQLHAEQQRRAAASRRIPRAPTPDEPQVPPHS